MPGNVQAISNLYDYGVHGSSSTGINPFNFNFMLSNRADLYHHHLMVEAQDLVGLIII